MAKDLNVIELFDCYKNLLTERQRKIFTEYYVYDYSLGEIAENENVSRQSVLDSVKKAEKQLFSYEENIRLNKIKKDIYLAIDGCSDQVAKARIVEILKEI